MDHFVFQLVVNLLLYLLKIRLLNENVFACIKYFLGFFNKKFACFGLLVI